MRKLRGHKLVMADQMEALFKSFTNAELRFRRQLLEEWWDGKLEHERAFHAPSSWLGEEDGDPG